MLRQKLKDKGTYIPSPLFKRNTIQRKNQSRTKRQNNQNNQQNTIAKHSKLRITKNNNDDYFIGNTQHHITSKKSIKPSIFIPKLNKRSSSKNSMESYESKYSNKSYSIMKIQRTKILKKRQSQVKENFSQNGTNIIHKINNPSNSNLKQQKLIEIPALSNYEISLVNSITINQNPQQKQFHNQTLYKSKKIIINQSSIQKQQNKTTEISSCLQKTADIEQKINIYLQIFNILAEYADQMKILYQDYEEWEDQIFLVYKKLFYQRKQILIAIKASDCSLFKLNVCTISKLQLLKFKNSDRYMKILLKLQVQNNELKNILIQIYKNMPQQAKQNVICQVQQNYSKVILFYMWNEMKLLEPKINKQSKDCRIKRRIIKILQSAFLICELNSESILNFQQCLDVTDFNYFYNQGSMLFQQYIVKNLNN